MRFAIWQPSDLPQVYLKRAEACRIAAEKTSKPEIRAAYMDVATQWEALAKARAARIPARSLSS
jgi:hypothetical protein